MYITSCYDLAANINVFILILNSITMVTRTVEEVKKKWADMRSLTKKRESEGRRSMRETGEGPANDVFFRVQIVGK